MPETRNATKVHVLCLQGTHPTESLSTVAPLKLVKKGKPKSKPQCTAQEDSASYTLSQGTQYTSTPPPPHSPRPSALSTPPPRATPTPPHAAPSSMTAHPSASPGTPPSHSPKPFTIPPHASPPHSPGPSTSSTPRICPHSLMALLALWKTGKKRMTVLLQQF
ncbi:hypothetical protein GYMLUDRAFT_240982 [Collybiopsis luxurians FD-317 M1]|nr:hypothetical protein GYMLUDRAFT_240982 [Collybiopsis luxurians FD-317 M1]